MTILKEIYFFNKSRWIINLCESIVYNELGLKVFAEGGYNPYLEDEGTLWLIHWLLASNSMIATATFWKPELTTLTQEQGFEFKYFVRVEASLNE
ncbi:DUF4007 family protein [Candidatus Venteria ishoeyi]|uniref:DUF4007 domain-containing protein n=1 Tax=Candidatus Venteria ishoeyi TaxID=1899563 RepID=A0A1H6F452_9GAMM|nr:DUF4007 family protein [Candidatus Venteria ishoeyi]SEH04937.1 Uncharacterised protein [Candidatus Venteria ishoeyi]